MNSNFFLLVSDKMCTFAHGYVLYVQFKDNQKGLNLASQIQS